LCGRALPLQRTREERRRDILVLLGESLLAPALLLLVLVLGAGIFALTIWLIPLALSLALRLLSLPLATWEPIVNWTALVLGGLMALALFLAPLLRAAHVHRSYWTRI
jgi:hypothetical protein